MQHPSSIPTRSAAARLARPLIGLCLALAGLAASANGLYWNVGVQGPGVVVGVANAAPTPVYVAPAPVYVASQPQVIYAPQPARMQPPPVRIGWAPPPHFQPHHHHHHRRHGHDGWHEGRGRGWDDDDRHGRRWR